METGSSAFPQNNLTPPFHPMDSSWMYLRSDYGYSENDTVHWFGGPRPENGSDPRVIPYGSFRFRVNSIVIPIICTIGILGNAFNFYVFYCRWFHKFMNDVEKSVTVGLMSLSLSDALFCLASIPSIFLFPPLSTESRSPALSTAALYYSTYRSSIINIFIFTSTWLIVAISLQRLVVVSWTKPRSCSITDARKTLLLHIFIFITSIFVCLPLMLRSRIRVHPCFSDSLCYFVEPWGPLSNQAFRIAYQVFWAVFGTVVPLVLLTVSNVLLILILYHGRYSTDPEDSSKRRSRPQITLLVVAIILTFVVLVAPSLIVDGLISIARSSSEASTQQLGASGPPNGMQYIVAITVTNLMQAIKFSFNFMLYCTVSRQFRSEMKTCRVNEGCRRT